MLCVVVFTGGKIVVDPSAEVACKAPLASASKNISVADSIILATARAYIVTVGTQGEHFKGVENEENYIV